MADRRWPMADRRSLHSHRGRRGFGHGTAGGPRLAAALIALVVLIVFLRRSLFGVRRFAQAAAADHRVGDSRGEQPNRAQRVVVTRNLEIDLIGIAFGVNDPNTL